MKIKIHTRLLLYFSGSLIIFSLIIGLIFSMLFSRHNKDVHKAELEKRAVNIAQTLADFWIGSPEQGQGHGITNQSMGYGAYLRFLDDIAMTDVWVVNRNLKQITRGRGQEVLEYKDLPPGAEEVIMAALEGSTTFSESFGAFLGAPSITVAAPIKQSNGEIAGAVLLHEQMNKIRGATDSGLAILLLSMGTAIVFSFFLAGALAKHFTKPLSQMKTAATKISQGDYMTKTGVWQRDEIGELARALDDMATKLDLASKESAKLEALRRGFVANISHELRTPVTVIRSSLEALSDGVVTEPHMVEEYHRQMLLESAHLERLVSDLLELTRLQNPDFIMDMTEVNLLEITKDAVRSIQRIADGKEVEIQLSYEGTGFVILGDYGRLRQILVILLDNAVKFSPNKGKVDIFLTSDQSTITLAIRDQGPGIPLEDLPHIFERFYKQRSEENKSGTGLGLSIVKQIAERHNIILGVKNRQDKGCEFSLVINKSDSHLQ